MSDRGDLDDTKEWSAFSNMIHKSLKTQEFSGKILAQGSHDGSVYLSLIASQNIVILELLTFLASSMKNFNENRETIQLEITTNLRNANYYLEKIAK